jgi:large subunit ribosomal protein L10
MLKQEKERVVAELVERLRTSETLIVADYRGLDMTEIENVRTELIKHGARFSVVKNTLTRRAAEVAGVDQLDHFLEGPTAIAFVGDGDMVAVAKALNDTARRTRVLALKGGILQGKAMTAADVQALAALPPVETLRGQVLGAIVAPVTALAGLVNAPLQNLHGLLEARIAQLEEQGDTSAQAAPAADAGPTEAEAASDEPAAEEPTDTTGTTESNEDPDQEEE